jgi:hypothetical protein
MSGIRAIVAAAVHKERTATLKIVIAILKLRLDFSLVAKLRIIAFASDFGIDIGITL